jgi:hypothetical protein
MKRNCSQPGLLLGLLTLILCPAPLALACGDDEELRVTVVAIYASEKDTKIDGKLTELAKVIRKKYPEFKGFQLGKLKRDDVVVGKERKFDLGDKQSAVVTVTHGCDEKDQVGLKVKVPCCFGECEYTTCCGKFLPLKTCHKTDKGECLIVAIMVKPCQGK